MNQDRPSILDKIQAGLIGKDEFRQEVLDQVYAGLHQYCRIPDGYRRCELDTRLVDLDHLDDQALRELLNNSPQEIVNPYPSQIRAVALFQLLLSGDAMVCEHEDPLSPSIGAYLYGPPGSGKTHLMAAYGRQLLHLLDDKLQDVHTMLGHFIDAAFAHYNTRIATEPEATDEAIGYLQLENGEITDALSPEDEFWARIGALKREVAEHEYQPTDLIYIGFQELFEVCKYSAQRTSAMAALTNARVVFIDDIHPQGDPEQIQLVLHLLERRYEMGRAGTFLTTNLTTRDLGGGDEMLGNRLTSRCAETLVTIDFSDCDDWRQKVKSRKIRLIDDELTRRAATHQHRRD